LETVRGSDNIYNLEENVSKNIPKRFQTIAGGNKRSIPKIQELVQNISTWKVRAGVECIQQQQQLRL
jgi:hypothetical protein